MKIESVNHNILISFIIPVYNSTNGIKVTLKSLIDQIESKENICEIVVVDNNSTDGTPKVIKYFNEKYSFIKVYQESKQGSYHARNKGIKLANGDLLCFVDADVKLEKKFVDKVIESYVSTNFKYAGFNVSMILPEKNNRTIYSDYDALTSFNDIEIKIKNAGYTPTVCLAIDKSIVDKVGMFDSRLESGGDVEFGKRVRSLGYEQIFLNDIKVCHPTRNSISQLRSKACRVGRGYAQLYKYHNKKFNYKYKSMKSLENFLPHNPLKLYRVNQLRGYKFSFIYCCLLSFIKIIIRYYQRAEFFENT